MPELAKISEGSTLRLTMAESLVDSSVTLKIIEVAPIRCRDCETLFTKGSALARRVLDTELTLEQARQDFQADLSSHCPVGQIARSASWGELARKCTYAE